VRESMDGRSTSYDDDDGWLDLVSVSLTTVVPERQVRWSEYTTMGNRYGIGGITCIEGRKRDGVCAGSMEERRQEGDYGEAIRYGKGREASRYEHCHHAVHPSHWTSVASGNIS
jgi:hypothetical protein